MTNIEQQKTKKEYKVVNGTSYSKETPNDVIDILEKVRNNGTRIRLFCGDVESGRDWLEEYGTIGTIGRSTGEQKIPLLLKTKFSDGGGAVLDRCIVKITIDKQTVYQHPAYHLPSFEIKEKNLTAHGKVYTHGVYAENINVANFESKDKAERWVKFIQGKRNSK